MYFDAPELGISQFWLKTINLPEITINTEEIQVPTEPIKVPNIMYTYGDISCTFFIDEDFRVYKVFYDWLMSFKVQNDGDHEYKIKTGAEGQLEIDVGNRFSLSSGQVPVVPGKKYKLFIKMKNRSANPVFLYSFWESSITQSRNYTFAGENGNPPTAETKELFSEWKSFEEVFQTMENEKFLVIRLYSEKGNFSLGEISIEEVGQ